MRERVNRSIVVMTLVFALIFAVSTAVWAAEVVILHTNDVHGRLVGTAGDAGEIGGLARLASLVEDMRDQYGKKVLLLDAGDAIHGTNVVNLFDGLSAIEVMNEMGYDALTLGNHEFNYGQDVLLERMADAKFPFLAANITTESGELLVYSALIQEVDGLRVGIIGVNSQDTPIATHPNNVEGLVFHDPLEVAKNLAVKIRPDVDLLIGLTHIGYSEDVKLAEMAPEFDVIVGGHSHTTLEDVVDIGGVLIVQGHEYANNLGFLRLEVEDKKVVDYEQRLIPVNDSIRENPEVKAIIDGWNVMLEDRLSQVVGRIEVDFDGERENVRTRATNLGNLIADVQREAVGADIGLANGGGIRASLKAGDVTVGDIYNVLPFDNTLSVIKIRGIDLLKALEFSTRLLPEQNGGFLQVSGLSFAVHPDGPGGKRIYNIRVNGEVIDLDKMYTVSTNDFLAVGGDGYEMLANGILEAETGIMLRDVMVDYFLEHGTVEEPEGNRIIFLN